MNNNKILCSDCWNKIYDFNQFYETVENAHKILIANIKLECEKNYENVNILSNQNNENQFDLCEVDVSVEIKKESIPIDYKYQDNVNDDNNISDGNNYDESNDVDYNVSWDNISSSENENDNDTIENSSRLKLECKECNSEFLTYGKFFLHHNKIHKSSASVECCGQILTNKSDALEHANKHHNLKEISCTVCEKLFKTKKILTRHMQNKHPSEKIVLDKTKKQLKIENQLSKIKTYNCSDCAEQFSKISLLRKHKKSVHETLSDRTCNECNRIFKTKSSLKYHMKGFHERSLERVCDICAKIFSSQSSLQHHYKNFHQYTGEEAVECNVCGLILKDKLNHKKHMLRHMEPSVACDICGKMSPNAKALKSHRQRAHFDTADHVCSVCKKSFKRKLALREHMATHTGEALYKCPYCPLTCNASSTLSLHKKTRHSKEKEHEEFLKRSIIRNKTNDTYIKNDENGASDFISNI